MPTPLESEISHMLKDGNEPSFIADELIRRWERNLLSEEQQLDCARFLIASTQYVRFFEQVSRLADQNSLLPWSELNEALGRGRVQLSHAEIEALFKGAEEQNAIGRLVHLKFLDVWDRRFPVERATQADLKLREIEAIKLGLRERLDFMRSQRLVSEEAKILDEIQMLFPNDPQFSNEKEAFEVRRANDVINRFAHSRVDINEELMWKSERLAPDVEEAKQRIVERARELIEKHPQAAYDLAIAMHFMDFNLEALELLNQTQVTPPSGISAQAWDWLRLELMIRARQFVDVLDYGSKLEVTYANDPETAFAVTYARAQALWGLGQHTMAIDLLSSLVRIRPNYRSASSLLTDWIATGGDQ